MRQVFNIKRNNWLETGQLFTIQQTAQMLSRESERNELFRFLRSKQILKKDNQPVDHYLQQGYFVCRKKRRKSSNGRFLKPFYGTLVTTRGIEFIENLISKEEEYVSR